MFMITKDMTIMEAIQNYPETIPVLQSLNLGCLGCIAASGESLAEGLSAHGLDVEATVKLMNEAVQQK
jgi:hybrid cluster-associated redox disulfide protein